MTTLKRIFCQLALLAPLSLVGIGTHAADDTPSRKSFSTGRSVLTATPAQRPTTPAPTASIPSPASQGVSTMVPAQLQRPNQPAAQAPLPLPVNYPANAVSPNSAITAAVRQAAAQLSRDINPNVKSRPTIVASIVDSEDLQKTSAFGRVVAQQLMYQLQAIGWPVVDLRVSRELTMKPEGEFVLSRDLSKARGSLQVGNVVSGTYTDSGGAIVVSLQVNDLGTGTVLTTAQMTSEINPYIASLFREDASPVDGKNIRKTR